MRTIKATRLMTFSVCLAMAVSVCGAEPDGGPEAAGGRTSTQRVVLYDQSDDPSGGLVPDQDFEAGLDQFDSEGAADFLVYHQRWLIDRVSTVGTYNTGGFVDSVDVSFHFDNGAVPGGVVPGCEYPETVPTLDLGGSLILDLVPGCLVEPGGFWLVVQTNMEWASSGQHYWNLRNNAINNDGVWRNPSGGWEKGCTEWAPLPLCGFSGWDYLFLLEGSTLAELWSQVQTGPELAIAREDTLQHQPSVAYNSVRDEYLVVWHEQTTPQRVRAQRVAANGTVFDSFSVWEETTSGIAPDVAYNPISDSYLVVWLDAAEDEGSGWDVLGRYVSGDGTLSPPIIVEIGTDNQWDPEIVFNSTQHDFLVVFTSAAPGVPEHVEGARVSGDPSLVWVVPVHVASGAADRRNPEVAYNASRDEYLVVYDVDTGGATGFDIAATRLSSAGAPMGAEIKVLEDPDADRRPVVASCEGRDEYVVLADRELTDGSWGVAGGVVEGDGTPGTPLAAPVELAGPAEPAVACGSRDSQYVLAWQDGEGTTPDRIVGGLWTRTNELYELFTAADTEGLYETTRATVRSGTDGTLVAWEQDRGVGGNQDIHARIVWPWIFANGFEPGDPFWSLQH